jgi:phage terminase large subunit-like protein
MSKMGPKPDPVLEPLDLSGLPAAGGDRVIGFCERFCFVPKGKGAKERLRLRPWQQQIVRGLYSEPRPRSGLLSLPRGNGKTTLAAFLACFELFGAGVESGQVLGVASDERQARILFHTVRRMIELEPELEARASVYFDKIAIPGSNSELRALPSEHAALQGWDPSFCVLDELHVVNEDVFEALELASGKRDRSLLLAISTPATTEDSVMWKLVEQGRNGDNPSFYFKEWAAPDGCDLDDEAAWHEANPALSDFLAIDALRSTRRTVREESFRRYRLGQWVQDEAAWLPLGVWASCATSRRLDPGAAVVLGFDGSVNNDATAIVAASIAERPHLEVVGLWEDQEIPILAVEDTIRAACTRFDVKALVADPFRWKRSLQILSAEGLPIEEYPQHAARMTPATQKFYAAALTGGLSHDGNPDLARHVANARVSTDARGTRIRKETKWSKARIDLAVAAIMAFDAASSYEPPKELVPFFGVTL